MADRTEADRDASAGARVAPTWQPRRPAGGRGRAGWCSRDAYVAATEAGGQKKGRGRWDQRRAAAAETSGGAVRDRRRRTAPGREGREGNRATGSDWRDEARLRPATTRGGGGSGGAGGNGGERRRPRRCSGRKPTVLPNALRRERREKGGGEVFTAAERLAGEEDDGASAARLGSGPTKRARETAPGAPSGALGCGGERGRQRW